MKKVFSFLLMVVLVLATFSISAYAAGNGTISLSGAAGKRGDTVNVNMTLDSNPGLITMKFTIAWGEGLELTGVSNGIVLAGWTTPSPTISSPYTLRWADSLSTTDNTATGKIATLTFKIKDDAAIGDHTVTLTFGESRDSGGGKNTFGNATAKITVNCTTHDYGTSFIKVNDDKHKQVCADCGHVNETAHTWDAGNVTKPADCKEAGNTHYTCTAKDCGAAKDVPIPKSQTHSYGAWQEVTPAKCTTPGEVKRVCSVCSNPETRPIEKLGHDFANPTVTQKPTCTEPGEKEGICSRCGVPDVESIPATGHSYGNWAMEEAATCTEAGKDVRECSVCKHEDTRVVKALGHAFKAPVIVKEPTLSEEGLMEGECSRCGETTSETIPCSAASDDGKVSVETEKGVFGADTNFSAEAEPEGSDAYLAASGALSEGQELSVWSLTFHKNGSAVQPKGKVSFTVPVPSFTVDQVLLLVDGEIKELDFEMDATAKTVTFESDVAGVFVLASSASDSVDPVTPPATDDPIVTPPAGDGEGQDTAAPATPAEEEKDSSSLLVGVIIIVLVVAAGIGVCFWYFVKKK